ncbi:MAG TPA: HAMP domain-containing sensor histidine kinase [Gaiellaceae bacterium]|jgi:signal transduction histidine kinase
MREWLAGHRQRLAYAVIAFALVATVSAGTVAGFRLHGAAVQERQSLHLEHLSGIVLRLQSYTLMVQGAPSPHRLERARATDLAAANAAFGLIASQDRDAAARIRPSYVSYLAASTATFDEALKSGGAVPISAQRGLEQVLTNFAAAIDSEVEEDSRDTHEANPVTRLVLFITVGSILILIFGFGWQFTLERRAGRIDRDNANRSTELMRLRDEFVASVSHELRTPLTSIIGYLELLRDARPGDPLPDQAAALEVVRRNADRLLRLVNDLLLVAELERGALTLDVRKVDLSALARHCVEAARPAAAAKEIELTLRDGSTATEVDGDPVRLAQMMDNLVSNAIKFTPRGGIVSVNAASASGGALFEVADSGAGISEAEQAQLFDRFFRARAASAEAAPGTGLGLTITKAIVDAHHGAIDIESSVGRGTTFRVRLPRRQRR